jgi:hypothetical protein
MNPVFQRTALLVAMLVLFSSAAAETAGKSESPAGTESGVIGKVEKAIVRGAKAAARGIERGAKAAARGVERGAKAAAGGVERGAKATGNAAHTAAEKVGGSSSTPSSSPGK